MLAIVAEPLLSLRVDPALAETVVFRELRRGGLSTSGALSVDRSRTEPIYAVVDPAEREAAFGRQAIADFDDLHLGQPILDALAERPALATRVRIVLIGESRGRGDEGITCEPGAEHLGIRIEASRFDDPAGLLAWARHALGHAEDTLDPEFAFLPGWQEAGSGSVAAASQARLHDLWDVSVDGRLAAAGRLAAEPARQRHRAAIARALPGIADGAIDAITARLWVGPRPSFAALLAWATRPLELARAVAPDEPEWRRPDRCPLCAFPSDDVAPPEPEVAARVVAEYPRWRPVQGLCGRCTDRYLLAGRLGGRP